MACLQKAFVSNSRIFKPLFRFLDVLLASFSCCMICIYGCSGWVHVMECSAFRCVSYRNDTTRWQCYFTMNCVTCHVALVAYQVILEPGISQFREFEPPRVHTRMNSWGLFSCDKLTCGKRESVSKKQHSTKKSTSSGIAEPYAR